LLAQTAENLFKLLTPPASSMLKSKSLSSALNIEPPNRFLLHRLQFPRLEEPNELVQIRSYEAHDVVKPVNKEDACGVFQPQSQPGNVQSPEA